MSGPGRQIRIGLAGAAGRMGRAVRSAVRGASDLVLTAVWESTEHPAAGAPFPGTGLSLARGPEGIEGSVDVAIDFSTPGATARLAGFCAEHAIPLVVGTTGLLAEHQAEIARAVERVPIVQAPNMSVGVNILLALAEAAAQMAGPAFDLEVAETHHRMKRDAPSGTALQLVERLRRARADASPVFARHGLPGARTDSEIGVQALRGGDVVGEHTVFLFGQGERLELTHRATDLGIFAAGALRAARWVVGKPPGLYSMSEVLAG